MNRHSAAAKPLSLAAFNDMLADAPKNERWELIGGRLLRMMVGARLEHARIVSNLNGELRSRLRAVGSPCRVLAETFRLETDDASLLPDIAVYCAPLPAGATRFRTAALVIEVLSESTAARDQGAKWSAYKTIATLEHYALVRTDRPSIEVYDRNGDRSWSPPRSIEGLGSSLDLPAIGVGLPLSEVYFDVF